jgi:ribosome-associated protein
MQKEKVADNALKLAEIIISGMQEKKAHDIVSMDLRKIDSATTDFFVICHGDSHRQVQAIAESVEEFVKKESGENAWHKEGYANKEWILLDYVNVVVHIFTKEARLFYDIESLWGDAGIKRPE